MWEKKNNALNRVFTFNNFSEAFAFMTRVAMIAEKQNHHPTWNNTWNKVEITLSTHDAGNTISEKDYQLASEIDKILKL
jgi:4a-hydroxytetrahydrobiopterin dehydratase